MSGVARTRLTQERKNWRKDHPFGFVAKPETLPDGSVDFLRWKCSIPGKKGTDFEGGQYPITLKFSEEYPSKQPECRLPAGFFHPNIYPSGKICLSIINDPSQGGSWKPSITIKQILAGIQDLLDNPNIDDAAQEDAYNCFLRNRVDYSQRVKRQAQTFHDPNFSC